MVPPLEKLRQREEAAGVGGGEECWSPGEPGSACSSPSRPGPRLLLISFPDTAGPESSALPATPAAPAACGLGGRSAAAREGGLAVPGCRAAPGAAQSCHRRGLSSFSQQPPSTGTCLGPLSAPCQAQLQAAQYMCPVPVLCCPRAQVWGSPRAVCGAGAHPAAMHGPSHTASTCPLLA